MKSYNPLNPCLAARAFGEGAQAGVIQTMYDTIKAHGGEIKVETKDGEGSEFIIKLPIA